MQQNFPTKFAGMWPESSFVNTVNLATKFTTVPEISNFS